ncbi:MAG: M48 family metallopeptidase [Neomegalonema sp.]|nr:M48 family metallopeptidase [Neomegalonema sp.]
MTASEKYALLEAEADYFDGETARSRVVLVRFGQTTLTLSNRNGEPVVSWPLATLRRLPGSSSGEASIRLIPDFGSDERLVLRDPAMIEAVEQVCPGLDERQPHSTGLRRKLVIWSLAAVSSVLVIVFVLAPLLAGTIATLMPPESEVAFGQSITDEIVEDGISFMGIAPGACHSEEGQRALDKMSERLAAHTDLHVPLNVQVLHSDIPNAFALPGGHVLILDGLFAQARSPEEVAGVLAHEIGHVKERHGLRNLLRAVGTTGILGLLVGDFGGGFAAAALMNAAVDASYSREAEREADAYALALLQRADLPSAPLGGFFMRLREKYGDSDSFLSSHPANTEREAMFSQSSQVGDFTPILDPQQWAALKDICAGRGEEDAEQE